MPHSAELPKERTDDPLLAMLPIGASTAHPEPTLADIIEFHLSNPVAWVEDIIGVTPDAWQAEALMALAQNRRVAVRSGHSVGKSCFDAWALLWFLSCHPDSRVVATAPTKEQLSDVLWAECYKWITYSKVLHNLLEWQAEKITVRSAPQKWFAAARTSEVRKLGKTGLMGAEGLQGRHAESLLVIVDEASGVDESILASLRGSLTNENTHLLLTGNPTRPSGMFFDAFHSKRHLWRTFHVNSEDVRNRDRVDPRWLAEMLEECNGDRNHPMYMVRVRGEFPPAGPNVLYSLEHIEACQRLDLAPSEFDWWELGVDVATFGDNETCIVGKHGPTIQFIDTYAQQSTMETVGRVVQYIHKYRPMNVKVDVVGVGAGVLHRLQELEFKECQAFNGAAEPFDKTRFVNARAEAHWRLRQLLEVGKLRLPVAGASEIALARLNKPLISPNVDKLVAQMTQINYKLTSSGKIQIESKDEMRRRSVKSPDALDAVVLACAQGQAVRASCARFGAVAFMGR